MNDSPPNAPLPEALSAFSSASLPAPRSLSIRFVGSGSEYFRIWIVNLLLILVTLGLYYPFAKLRKLRYFHGATEIDGHPLAFHGNGWAMFRGHVLVALMVGLYTVAGQVSAEAAAVAFVIVALLWPALWHSSLRFRLANTEWRGLRFRFTGSRGQAYVTFWPALGVLVLLVLGGAVAGWVMGPEVAEAGAADPADDSAARAGFGGLFGLLPLLLIWLGAPWLLWRLCRYQHQNYALAGERTAFVTPLLAFYRVFGAALLLILALLAVVVAAVFLLAPVLGLGEGKAPSAVGVVLAVVLGMLAYLLFFSVLGGFVTARLQNLVWCGTASAGLSFQSGLSASALMALWFKNGFLTLITLGLYYPFAAIASARLRLEAMAVECQLDVQALVAQASHLNETAAGDAAGDLLGIDIGL